MYFYSYKLGDIYVMGVATFLVEKASFVSPEHVCTMWKSGHRQVDLPTRNPNRKAPKRMARVRTMFLSRSLILICEVEFIQVDVDGVSYPFDADADEAFLD